MPVSVAIGREPTGRPIASATVGSAAVLYGDVDPAELAETLRAGPVVRLPRGARAHRFHGRWPSAVDWIFAKPVTIAIIVIVAWVVVRILDRVIDRFVRSIAGQDRSRRAS